MDRYSSLDTQKKEIDQEVDHLLNCDESDVTIDVSEKDEEKELSPEQLTTVSTIVSQNDTVNEEKQDGDNLVSFQIGGDDISYKETDITPTAPNNKNNNTFSDNVPMNSQYATVDSVDSVRFAKHATVFTVPRHKHSIKKKKSKSRKYFASKVFSRFAVCIDFGWFYISPSFACSSDTGNPCWSIDPLCRGISATTTFQSMGGFHSDWMAGNEFHFQIPLLPTQHQRTDNT